MTKIGSREWAVEAEPRSAYGCGAADRASRRISDALAAADSGGYGRSGWASYIDRTDVEAVLEHREELVAQLRRLKSAYLVETGKVAA